MRNKIFSLSLILAFFFLLGINSYALAAPQAYLEKEIINIGTLKEGKVNEFAFALLNKGDSELTINSVYAPCGCIKIVFPKDKAAIPPGSRMDIKYTLDSTGLNGKVIRYIYIYTNDPAKLNLKVTIQANVERIKEVVLDRFVSFNALAVVGAGLIDGFNPCAFTVLVFFISFLTFAGYNRQQIIILGSFFILAVAVTYVLIGLGLFEFFRRLEVFYFLSHLVYLLTAILALILGGFSLYDYWIFKKTNNPEAIKLKLPEFVKQQIHKVIREKTDTRGRPDLKSAPKLKLAMAALTSGFVVSILESICTGQMYLPTIIYVLGFAKLKMRAIGYLLLYNLMFILPLVGVFMLGLFGMTSEGFAKLARRHLATIKIITSAVFFGLGIGLLLIIKK
jgi:hypothetical protein